MHIGVPPPPDRVTMKYYQVICVIFCLVIVNPIWAKPREYYEANYPTKVNFYNKQISCPTDVSIGHKVLYNETNCSKRDGWLVTDKADNLGRKLWLYTGINYQIMGETTMGRMSEKNKSEVMKNGKIRKRYPSPNGSCGEDIYGRPISSDYFTWNSGGFNIAGQPGDGGGEWESNNANSCPNMPDLTNAIQQVQQVGNDGCIDARNILTIAIQETTGVVNAGPSSQSLELYTWDNTNNGQATGNWYLPDSEGGATGTGPVYDQVNAYTDESCNNYDFTFDMNDCIGNLADLSLLPFAQACAPDGDLWELDYVQSNLNGQLVWYGYQATSSG